MIYWPTKAPTDIIDYGMDWSPFLSKLATPTPTISSTVWSLVSGDVTLGADLIEADMLGTVVRLSGGTDGTEAIVRCQVTLSNGQSFHEEAFLKIRAL